MDAFLEDPIDQAAMQLANCHKLLVITGAGISADSGLPTYRGVGGLYEDAETEDEVPIEVALSGPMMQRRPEVTWKYLMQIENACRGAQANDGHRALARMQNRFDRMTVLTQNVDGFHHDAGQGHVIEIHGNVHELYCTECGDERWVRDYSELKPPPRCDFCHGLVRPRVVLFEEMLPQAALNAFEEALDYGVDAVISIGTNSGFPYIAGPVIQAARMGLPTIEINPGTSEVSSQVGIRIADRAINALPRIEKLLDVFRAS